MGGGCSACFHSTYDPAVLTLEHYEIHRVVGKGGFGKVNAVIRKRTKPSQWFAIKTLSKATIVKKQCIKMIWNERNLLASIQNPHIVAMYHAFQDKANCYVVMDLLLGGDLKFHLSGKFKGGFPEPHARFYVAGLLLALRYLHSLHILHRDIKPDNVILDNDGYPRLTDFGISVATDTMRFKGNSGTTSYMAPEMFVGSNEHGIGADFYALGVMGCELLFGRKLWTTSAMARIEERPEILESLPPERESEYYPSELLDTTASSPLSPPCRAFLRGMLYPAEKGRLGCTNGAEEVMQHAWFKGFDWRAYETQTMAAPFKPVIDEKQANCDTAVHDFDDMLELSARSSGPAITPEQQQSFVGFEFNVAVLVKSTASITANR